MAKNRICDGNVLTYTNTTGADILSGSPVVIGALLGVALVDINDDLSGSVAIEGVYELPKGSVTITQGVKLYWDADSIPVGGSTGTGALTTTATDNAYAGVAMAAAVEAAATVQIKLNA